MRRKLVPQGSYVQFNEGLSTAVRRKFRVAWRLGFDLASVTVFFRDKLFFRTANTNRQQAVHADGFERTAKTFHVFEQGFGSHFESRLFHMAITVAARSALA